MDKPDDDKRRPLIEVDQFQPRNVPRHVPSEQRAGESVQAENGPVPPNPLHLCPNCDYELTGLMSRRCPECGEEFTLVEARIRAFEKSEGVRRWMVSDRVLTFKLWTGIALIVLSVWLQNFARGSVAGWLGLNMSFRGCLMLVFMIPLGFGAILFRVARDKPWSALVWWSGLVAMGLSGWMSTI